MKKIFSLLLLALLASRAPAQSTFALFFEQKKLEIQYLEQQIVALEAFTVDLEKGYKIVQGGLTTINDLKHGEFNLHNLYFSSLLAVNPAIGSSPTVSTTQPLQQEIAQQCQITASQVTSSGVYAASEVGYVQSVLSNLLAGCNADIAELSTLTTPGNYSVQDAQRLSRIDAIHQDILDKYQFAKHFGAQVALQAAQRGKEQGDVQGIGNMYDLK
jgi:hypothetical protein